MGIFHFTRQNHVTFSEDWRLFADIFPEIGVFTYRASVQTAFLDENASRILHTGKTLSGDAYTSLLQKLTAEPADDAQGLYLLRSGAEKRYIRLHLTSRGDDTLGFVEEVSRRITQSAADSQEYDTVTSMLRFPVFCNRIQRRMQETERLWIAALQVEGLEKITGFVPDSSSAGMSSVAEVLNRFSAEDVLLSSKSFQNFFVCFINMDEQSVLMQLEQMREAIAACTLSDDFGQPLPQQESFRLVLRIGLVACPDEGTTLSQLLPYAEFALFETQHDRHNPVNRFSLADYERRKDEYREEQLFNTVIGENQLSYHFQPIVDAHSGEVVAYEALMRSEHFDPAKILMLADKLGRPYDIERATLFNCMRYLSEHQNAFSGRSLFINCLTTALLTESDFNELVLTYEDLFEKVVMEITEQGNSAKMRPIFQARCDRLGVRIAVDDYGSGYANTATLLQSLPHYVKIDHCLIDGICRDQKKQQLVSGIIDYAHDNQITVLAEGVEKEDDLRTLIRMGIDLVQGYLTARPKPYLLEEISTDVRDMIINTNLETDTGRKKVYNAHNDEVLDVVKLALENYTDIHIYRHKLTIIGDPDKTVPMHLVIMENHSCELTLRNVHLLSKEKPAITVGSYAQLTLFVQGNNFLDHTGICVPPGSFFHLLGEGNLKIDSYSKFGCGIGGDCNSGYGCITLESTGRVDIICSGDRSVGIGGGNNPDDAEICLKSGDIHVDVGSPNAVGIGCADGFSQIYADPGCSVDMTVNGINCVGVGSLSGETRIEFRSDLRFNGSGSRVVGMGALNTGSGEIRVYDSSLFFFLRTNFGTCIGSIGGDVNVGVQGCKIEVDAEGGEVTGVGDARGDGDVTLENTELRACIFAGKPREAGSRNGSLTMHSSMIVADINEKRNTKE